MLVSELIAKLQHLPQNAVVVVAGGMIGEWWEIDNDEVNLRSLFFCDEKLWYDTPISDNNQLMCAIGS